MLLIDNSGLFKLNDEVGIWRRRGRDCALEGIVG